MSTQTACFNTFVYLDNNFNTDALIDARINMGNKYKYNIDSYAFDKNLINDKSDNFGIYTGIWN